MGYGDDLPYRTPGISPGFGQTTQPSVSQDEAQYNTLKAVYLDMKETMDTIDKWHAFDLDEKTAGVTIKQQILAHRRAYEMIAPSFQALETAVEQVDRQFIERQRSN